MRRHQRSSAPTGFSVVEMLVVIAIMGILATMGIPWLQNILHRTKMEGLISNSSTMFRLARSESIKQNVRTVVRFDLTLRRVEAFADRDGDTILDPPDGVYNPVAGEPFKTTDYWLGSFDLPAGIEFAAPAMLDEVDGFTTVDNNGLSEEVAILLSDGSITDIGAVRLGDARGNFFEIRIAPQGTARVQVQKWDDIEADWFEKGEDGFTWSWL